jgi:L-amino acid N-acyltransferase YncA
MNISIIAMTPDFWPAVREIYGEGIQTRNATFETTLPDWDKWNSGHRKECRLVAVESEGSRTETDLSARVLGWAALSPVSARHVYRGVAEVSVYVAAAARGRGVGKTLLTTLVQESEANGIWTLQAGIFPENVASLTLHKSCGFREIGVRRRISKLGDQWRDVVLLERRSATVGV